MLLGFKLSGVSLEDSDKKQFEEIEAHLAKLSNQFENNVLDATQDYHFNVTDIQKLEGLPEHALYHARQLAESKHQEGFVLNLEIPCYLAVMTYAKDRQLREEIYKAYIARASEVGPSAGKFDNKATMDDILALRHKKATLLGFQNYAEYSLATKMASSPEEVLSLLNTLKDRAFPQAKQEFEALQQFAKEKFNLFPLKPWDIAYVSEQKKQALFDISEEALRPYFPLPKVLSGLLVILEKLYGIKFEEVKDVDVWHKDVSCYCIKDEKKAIRGYIYTDLFARQNKRGGAWMDTFQSRRCLKDGTVQTPIATLNCNFAKPAGTQQPTLSHDELNTLFHELGHCLHHVLTKVTYLSVSGIHGVEWDAVELPSQFFENWCWQEEALELLTSHIDNGETLPFELLKQLLAAKNFQSAMAMLRQLEFSLFDFYLHQNYKNEVNYIADTLASVRKNTSVIPIEDTNRFQNSFTHVFSGGYAAGYYSYKWAEVLSSDAFERFEEEGVFNEKTGRDFLHCILEVGGSKKAEEAYVAFRGRKAKVDALLKHNGIR